MTRLRDKTILIISPQAWGKMFVSKHHYAVELAKRGNKVYFVNPPDQTLGEAISIVPSLTHENLFLINHKLFFPYRLKFRALPVFHWLIQFQIRQIRKKIEKTIDIVWSFDLGNLYPFRFFDASSVKIFHPVDEPSGKASILAAKGAQVIFSVTREILEKYEGYPVPKHFVNHGVTENFLMDVAVNKSVGSIRVGFSGNMLRNDIDRSTLLRIVTEHPDCTFEFWGSYSLEQANMGGTADSETTEFIGSLLQQKNVLMHGAISSGALATQLRLMDILLICYDVQRDQSKGTNYHKVMEFLATGKVIVSNNITTYKNHPFLIEMISERDNNNTLPALFTKVKNNLEVYNSADRQRQRVLFATDNVYSRQLDRIADYLQTI